MTANVYATRADLYKYGLPRGTLSKSARVVASCLATTDAFTLDDHGFEAEEAVVFRAADGGTLPSPIVEGTTYYVVEVNDVEFKASATAGGSAINLTTDGSNVVVATSLPVDDVLEFYSRWCDGFLVAHGVPLTADDDGKYPVLVRGIVAQLACARLLQLAGHASDAVEKLELACKAQLERWSKGVTLTDAAQSSTNTAVVSSTVATITDARGWGSRSLP